MKEDDLLTLFKVSQELAATLNLQRVLQITTDRVCELSGLKSAAVYLRTGETLHLWATTPPLPPQFPIELRNASLADHPHIRKAITTAQPVLVPDTATAELTPAEQAVTKMRDLRSILYLPLVAGAKVTGILIVATVAEPRSLSGVQIDLCHALAKMAALAVENARLYESSQCHAADLEQTISVHRLAEEVLRKSEERWKFALEGAGDGVWDWNIQTGEALYSKHWKEMLGFAEHEIWNSSDEWFRRIHPDDMPGVMTALQAHLDGKTDTAIVEFRALCKDGRYKWILGRGMVVSRDAHGKPLRLVGTNTDIAERKQREEELKKTKERYDFAASIGKIGTWDWDPVTGELIWNDETFRILGLAAGAVTPSYDLFLSMIHPEDRKLLDNAVQAALHEKKPYSLDCRIVPANGLERICNATGRVEFDENDRPVRMLGTFQDITERKQMENAINQENDFRKELINALPGIFYMLDTAGNCLMWNRNLENILRCSSEEIAQGETLDFIAEADHLSFEQNLRKAFETGEASMEAVMVAKDGTRTPFFLTGKRIVHNGQPVLIGLGMDITERKLAEGKIRKLAHFDSLTDLPNRTLLTDRVNQAISMAQRSHGKLALLFVDLDHFKNINDTLGHRIGDELLFEIARRLQAVVRDEDTVSRLGGDEFILLLPGADTNGAAHVARKILVAVSQHYLIEQHELVITPSIGIAMYPGDGENFDALSRCADIAMYRAKQDGRNNYRFFTPEMQARSARNLQLENALRRALEREQLQLHYQPQLSLHDGRVIGAEALLRWQHPELGMISPAEFIPVAEGSGLILPIGEWVLRTAIRQLKTWMDRGMPPMVMAVNLSAVQLRQPNLLNLVTQILKEENLPPQLLELELTEGATMNDPATAITLMDGLHQHGIRMAIDDFGTGYSSLSQLKRFQVYKLKIDQSFVRDIVEDPDDKAIVAAIISMARSLGIQTIAEGVETREQFEFLQENSCDEIQGYYFSKPVAAEQFENFVQNTLRRV